MVNFLVAQCSSQKMIIFRWLWIVVFHVWPKKIKGVPIQGWGFYLDHVRYLCCGKRFSSHQGQNKGCCFLVNDQNLDFWGMINALVVHVQNQWACVPHLPLFSTFRSGNPLINPLMKVGRNPPLLGGFYCCHTYLFCKNPLDIDTK